FDPLVRLSCATLPRIGMPIAAIRRISPPPRTPRVRRIKNQQPKTLPRLMELGSTERRAVHHAIAARLHTQRVSHIGARVHNRVSRNGIGFTEARPIGLGLRDPVR